MVCPFRSGDFFLAVKYFFRKKIPRSLVTSKMHGIGKVMAKLPAFMNDSSSESSYHSENDDDMNDEEDVVVDVAPPSPVGVQEEEKVPSKKGQMRLKKYQKALTEYASKYATLRDDDAKSAHTLEFAMEYPPGKSKSRKAGKNKPRRQSAYNVFFTQKLRELKDVGKDNSERLTMVGKMWKEMGENEKVAYQTMADNKNVENDPTYDANAVKKTATKAKTPEQLFLRWLKEQMVGMEQFAGVTGKELHSMALKEAKKEEYEAKKKEFYHNY